jgi:hypothetical protein
LNLLTSSPLDVRWGMVIPCNWIGKHDWDQQTLHLGFNQSRRHRNHRALTYEMWIYCDIDSTIDSDIKSDQQTCHPTKDIVLFARGVGDPSMVQHAAKAVAKYHDDESEAETSENDEKNESVDSNSIASSSSSSSGSRGSSSDGGGWQWAMYLRPVIKNSTLEYRLMFHTSSSTNEALSQQENEEEDGGGTGFMKCRSWSHVALTIENNQENNGKVMLLLNGKQVVQGNATAPLYGEKDNANKNCGLFIMPNVEVSLFFPLFYIFVSHI